MDMEMNTQDTSGEVTTAINKTALIVVIAVLLALAGGLGAGYLVLGSGTRREASVAPSPTSLSASPGTATPMEAIASQPTQSAPDVPAAYLAQPDSAEEMFSEFLCPCCGQPIGDCACGMAPERRGFVTGLVSAGQNRLEIYLAYADQYGLDAFASQEAQEEVREYKLANAPAERPQIVLASQQIDLGDVSVKGGKAETSVAIENTGQSDLVVDGLSTSCGCTTASVVNDGQEGPVFGMIGMGTPPPEGWYTTIRPGETAELRIYYDPNVHKDARGPMVREVYISSNDPIDPVVKVSVELNQVD